MTRVDWNKNERTDEAVKKHCNQDLKFVHRRVDETQPIKVFCFAPPTKLKTKQEATGLKVSAKLNELIDYKKDKR